MENVRKFFQHALDFVNNPKNYHNGNNGYKSVGGIDDDFQWDCTDSILNKLFMMDDIGRRAYAEHIGECIEAWCDAFIDSEIEIKEVNVVGRKKIKFIEQIVPENKMRILGRGTLYEEENDNDDTEEDDTEEDDTEKLYLYNGSDVSCVLSDIDWFLSSVARGFAKCKIGLYPMFYKIDVYNYENWSDYIWGDIKAKDIKRGNRIKTNPPSIPEDILQALENKGLITRNPLRWGNKDFSLCAYFIRKYFGGKYPDNLWSIGKEIFGLKNLSQLEFSYFRNNNSKPKKHKIIDDILIGHV